MCKKIVRAIAITGILAFCGGASGKQDAQAIEIFEPVVVEDEPVPLAVGAYELPELLMEIDVLDEIVEPVEEIEDPLFANEPVKMRVTCYLPTGNPTASGVMPFVGGCAAKREWMGGAAVLYTLEGEYLGVWTINDTGGHSRITSGQSLDLFMEDMSAAKKWIAEHGDYLLVQVFPEAKG